MPEVIPKIPRWRGSRHFAEDVFGAALSAGLEPGSAAILTAHASLETGWGEEARGFNLFGIKTSSSQPYYHAATFEYEDGVRVELPPGATKWRAFETLDEGVKGGMDLLANMARYRGAYRALLHGDPQYFAELHQAPARQGKPGWYTAPVAVYYYASCGRLREICEWTGVMVPPAAQLTSAEGRQNALGELGYRTLREAQRELGASVDGIWGPESWTVLTYELIEHRSC